MVYFMIIYLCIVVIYFEHTKKNDSIDLGMFIIALLIPVFGFFVVVLYNLNKSETVIYEFEEEREKEIDDLDNFLLKNSHSNFEANLLLKSYKEARKEIVNFGKLDVDENSSLYMKALKSEDTEVSHMAAASLMKVKQGFEKGLNLSDNVQFDELERYIFTLDEYVRNNLVIGVLKEKLVQNAINLAEKIISFRNDKLEYFMAYLNLLIEAKEYELATEYAQHMTYMWPDNELAWYALFDILIRKQDRVKLNEKINEYEMKNMEQSEKMRCFLSFWRE